jgi:hypothetical protein
MILTGESDGTGELPLRHGSDLEFGGLRHGSDLEFGGHDQSSPGQLPYKQDPSDVLEFQADLTKQRWTLRSRGQLAGTAAGVMGLTGIWAWSGDRVIGIFSLSVFSILTALQLALRNRRRRG